MSDEIVFFFEIVPCSNSCSATETLEYIASINRVCNFCSFHVLYHQSENAWIKEMATRISNSNRKGRLTNPLNCLVSSALRGRFGGGSSPGSLFLLRLIISTLSMNVTGNETCSVYWAAGETYSTPIKPIMNVYCQSEGRLNNWQCCSHNLIQSMKHNHYEFRICLLTFRK